MRLEGRTDTVLRISIGKSPWISRDFACSSSTLSESRRNRVGTRQRRQDGSLDPQLRWSTTTRSPILSSGKPRYDIKRSSGKLLLLDTILSDLATPAGRMKSVEAERASLCTVECLVYNSRSLLSVE